MDLLVPLYFKPLGQFFFFFPFYRSGRFALLPDPSERSNRSLRRSTESPPPLNASPAQAFFRFYSPLCPFLPCSSWAFATLHGFEGFYRVRFVSFPHHKCIPSASPYRFRFDPPFLSHFLCLIPFNRGPAATATRFFRPEWELPFCSRGPSDFSFCSYLSLFFLRQHSVLHPFLLHWSGYASIVDCLSWQSFSPCFFAIKTSPLSPPHCPHPFVSFSPNPFGCPSPLACPSSAPGFVFSGTILLDPVCLKSFFSLCFTFYSLRDPFHASSLLPLFLLSALSQALFSLSIVSPFFFSLLFGNGGALSSPLTRPTPVFFSLFFADLPRFKWNPMPRSDGVLLLSRNSFIPRVERRPPHPFFLAPSLPTRRLQSFCRKGFFLFTPCSCLCLRLVFT